VTCRSIENHVTHTFPDMNRKVSYVIRKGIAVPARFIPTK